MSFRWRSGSLVLGLLFVVVGASAQACGGDDDNNASANGTPDASAPIATPDANVAPVSTPTQASGKVGTAGGSVVTTGGSGVEIPAGALPGDVNISVAQSASTAPPAGSTAVGTPYIFGPSGLQFLAPVTVVLEIDATKLPSGKTAQDIVVFTAPDGTTNFQQLSTSVRDTTHVAAQTTHFSILVPVIPGTAPIDASAGDDDDASTGGDDAGASDSGGGSDASTNNDAGGGGSDASTNNDAGGGSSDASTNNDAGGGASDASTTDSGSGSGTTANGGACPNGDSDCASGQCFTQGGNPVCSIPCTKPGATDTTCANDQHFTGMCTAQSFCEVGAAP